MRITARNINAIPDYPGEAYKFDLEKVLPLELVRTHTKTDDTPHVTDEQLELYRAAAFEAAEKYTGLLLTRQQVIREPIASESRRGFRRVRKHRLKKPTVDGRVYMYGGGLLQAVPIMVTPGTRDIQLPIVQEALDASTCCRPDSLGGENFGMSIMYMAGIENETSIPKILIMGCLKYIAWAVQNPGDVVMTVKNRTGAGEAGIVGTNNGAWASGAIEDWRMVMDDDI